MKIHQNTVCTNSCSGKSFVYSPSQRRYACYHSVVRMKARLGADSFFTNFECRSFAITAGDTVRCRSPSELVERNQMPNSHFVLVENFKNRLFKAILK